ncbi:MAG: DUF4886 domain-containing protein [Bacteroides clarus]|nr:DUF4886 domain-containing protein [Bacteroides clarus]
MIMKNLLLKSKTLLNVLFILMVTLTGSVTLLTACSEDDDTTQNLSNTWMKSTSDEVELEIGVRTPVNLLFKDAVAEKLEYTCTSSDAAVATAALSKGNKTVTIEGLAEGTADIKIAYASSALDNLTATITVTVSKPSGDYEAEYADNGRWMKAAVEKAEVNIDEETPVALTFSDDEMKALEYECKSFDEAVAIATGFSMDADNNKIVNVKGVKVGTTKVKIQYWKPLEGGGRRIIRCLSDTIEVSVKDRLAGATMTLAKEEMKLKPSEEMQIPMIFGTDVDVAATDYICTSSAADVATAEVEEIDGKLALIVKAKVDGETDIKVEYSKNGRKNETLSGNVKIKVLSNLTRILAIGNSYSQDAVEQYLYDLAKAAGYEVIIGNMYIGGCDLETHWANMQSDAADYIYKKIVDGTKTEFKERKLSQTLNEEKWDYISLQQKSGKSGDYTTYTSYLPNLITALQQTNPDAELMWHQTWAYASDYGSFPSDITEPKQENMYNAIVAASFQAMQDNPALKILIPSGTAIQNGRTSYLGDTFNRDGTHLNTAYGRYTAACTWFDAIFETEVVGNSYVPATVSAAEATIAQNSAHMAIKNRYEVTDMSIYNPSASGKLAAPIYVDFNAAQTTDANKTGLPWNNVTDKTTTSIWLHDAGENYTGIRLKVSDFNATGWIGTTGGDNLEAIVGDIVFPRSAWTDGLLVKGNNQTTDSNFATIEISRMDPNEKYDFIIMAVRNGSSQGARMASYRIEGSSIQNKENFDINLGVKGSISNSSTPTHNSWNDVDLKQYIITFNGIQPKTDGTVTIGVKGMATGKTSDGIINALVIKAAE